MMVRSRWILASLVLCFLAPVWAPVAGAQEKATRLPFTAKHLQDSLRADWYGVYWSGKKIGYATSTLAEVKEGNDHVYRNTFHMVTKTKAAGFPLETETIETEDFDGQAPYALRKAHQIERQGTSRQVVTVTRGPDGYQATISVGGKKRTKHLKHLDHNLSDLLTSYVWLLGRPKIGARLTTHTFDFDKLRLEPEHHKMLAVKTSLVKGVQSTFYEVEVNQPAQKAVMFERFDAEGNLLSTVIDGVCEMRLETEKDSQRLDQAADLFTMGLVKIDRGIGDYKTTAALVVELQGKGASLVANGARQRVTRTPDGKYLCQVGQKYANHIKATAKELEECLEDTTSYPAHDTQIQALAKKAIGNAQTPREKVQRLVRFVHNFIQPSYRVKGLVVLDLLEKKAGDCTAYAALFTTLARAAGIPAREVSGFAYMGDSDKAFGGHAWNEVVLDGAWHPIDASVGAFEVDAARISMGNDTDGGSNLLKTFGGLSLRLITVEHGTVQARPVGSEQPRR